VTFAAGRMITAKGLSAGRHIFLETTYRVRFETSAFFREPSQVERG